MKFKKYGSFVVVILFLGVIVFFLTNQNIFLQKTTGNDIKFVQIAGQIIKVDLALTPLEQERGLSGRESLKNDEGMLFIFPKPSINYFWMKRWARQRFLHLNSINNFKISDEHVINGQKIN